MKFNFTLFLLLFVLNLNAQTFTYSNYSAALTSTLYAALADESSFNVSLTTTTGNGVTWDASGITQQNETPTIEFVYGDPSTTPNGSLYSAANYVQYDPALMNILEYGYYNIYSYGVEKVGSYAASTQHEVYDNYDRQLIFPFEYGQSFMDTYTKTNYSDATTVSSYQYGVRTGIFSGYGTLILPQGTFTNVALISTERTNNLGPTSTTYTWYDINNGKQLLYYEENAGDVVVAFNTDALSGIAELNGETVVSVYPNPFSTSATVRINTGASMNDGELVIYDMLGNEIKRSNVNSHTVMLSGDGMSRGLYCFKLITNQSELAFGKIMVE